MRLLSRFMRSIRLATLVLSSALTSVQLATAASTSSPAEYIVCSHDGAGGLADSLDVYEAGELRLRLRRTMRLHGSAGLHVSRITADQTGRYFAVEVGPRHLRPGGSGFVGNRARLFIIDTRSFRIVRQVRHILYSSNWGMASKLYVGLAPRGKLYTVESASGGGLVWKGPEAMPRALAYFPRYGEWALRIIKDLDLYWPTFTDVGPFLAEDSCQMNAGFGWISYNRENIVLPALRKNPPITNLTIVQIALVGGKRAVYPLGEAPDVAWISGRDRFVAAQYRGFCDVFDLDNHQRVGRLVSEATLCVSERNAPNW